jgi:DNA (cytosine-5)-methyltransferase 1
MTTNWTAQTESVHDVALSTGSGQALSGLALCAGYAGLELGLHIAEPGYRTVCYVEREAHAAATLVARMAEQALADAPIWDDLATFDGSLWCGRVHILSAGYPCQPFSTSGRRRGFKDPRNLWSEVARVIGEVRPEWVFLENVLGHLALGFPEVARGLQKLDYLIKAGVFTAFEVGASHQRARLFVLAHADGQYQWKSRRAQDPSRGHEARNSDRLPKQPDGAQKRRRTMDTLLAASENDWLLANEKEEFGLPTFAPAPGDLANWHEALRKRPDLQPALCGVVDGFTSRLDELRAAGNGVCPLAAAYAYRTLKDDFPVGN